MIRTGTFVCSQYVQPFSFIGGDGKKQEAGNYYINYVMFDDDDYLFRFYMTPSEFEKEVGIKLSDKKLRMIPFICDFSVDTTGKKIKCGLSNFEFQR